MLGGRDSRVEYLRGARSYFTDTGEQVYSLFNPVCSPVGWVVCPVCNCIEITASHDVRRQASTESGGQLGAGPSPLPIAAPSGPREACGLDALGTGWLPLKMEQFLFTLPVNFPLKWKTRKG